MKVKEYKLFKTAKKTASENNLVIAERTTSKDAYRLFDFSELDTLYGIPENEKEIIKKSALKHVCSAFSNDYYGKEIDNFTACDGISKFYCYRIYNESGKLLYRIFQLVALNHKHMERNSIYNNYTTTTYEMTCGWSAPMLDYEI